MIKYEIENFKDEPVTLDISENLPSVRRKYRERRIRTRHVQWDMLPETDMIRFDKEKSTFENILFHVELPARDKDGIAEKLSRKLHIKFRNEW